MNTDVTTQRYVTSRDGTRIGYLRQGRGPGVVLVQGAMGSAHDFAHLARALAPTFTVYRPDRRGRGMSPKPYEPTHTIARDVEDIEALLAETGAELVFGLSSGAMITLAAARALPRITRAAVYEPPFYRGGVDHAGIHRLGAEIERDEQARALVSALLIAGTAPAPLRVLPAPVARLLAAVVLRVQARLARPNPSLRDMLPGIRYDFADVAAMNPEQASLRSLDTPVLLLGGTKSPAFLRQAVRDLDGLLPDARLVEFPGLNHGSSWNRRGAGVVATALREFFA